VNTNHDSPRSIWLARHGNRIDFIDSTWRERAERPHDPPLSPDGIIQARKLGLRLKSAGLNHIFSSPFLRTVQTAVQVAEATGLPVKLEKGLGEFLNPIWFPTAPKLLSVDELARQFPCIDTRYVSRGDAVYPEHDEINDCWPRAAQTARRLVQQFPGNLLLVGHGATVAGATYGLVEGYPELHCGLCCLIQIELRDGKGKLVLNGDDCHLR
jgi:broad specificity phosphatase PhoE